MKPGYDGVAWQFGVFCWATARLPNCIRVGVASSHTPPSVPLGLEGLLATYLVSSRYLRLESRIIGWRQYRQSSVAIREADGGPITY